MANSIGGQSSKRKKERSISLAQGTEFESFRKYFRERNLDYVLFSLNRLTDHNRGPFSFEMISEFSSLRSHLRALTVRGKLVVSVRSNAHWAPVL